MKKNIFFIYVCIFLCMIGLIVVISLYPNQQAITSSGPILDWICNDKVNRAINAANSRCETEKNGIKTTCETEKNRINSTCATEKNGINSICATEKNALNTSLADCNNNLSACNGPSDLYIAYSIQDSNQITFNWSISDRIFYSPNVSYGVQHISMNQKETDGSFSKWSFAINASRPNENIDTNPYGNNSIGVIKKSRVFCIINGNDVVYSNFVNVNHVAITNIVKNGNSIVVDWKVSSQFDNLYSTNSKYIIQITDNSNQNYSFNIDRNNLTDSGYSKNGKATLSNLPSTLKTILIFLFDTSTSNIITTSRHYSFQTNWMESSTAQILLGEGRQFLNTSYGNNWLTGQAGKAWLTSTNGNNWLIGTNGKAWLIGEGGKAWLRSADGSNWLIGTNGNNWLIGENGKAWLRTSDGSNWLIGTNGNNWLIGEGGKAWLTTTDGNNWLIGTNGKAWLMGEGGKAWLRSADGNNWLIGTNGKSWLLGEGGRNWLTSVDGSNWSQTMNGRALLVEIGLIGEVGFN